MNHEQDWAAIRDRSDTDIHFFLLRGTGCNVDFVDMCGWRQDLRFAARKWKSKVTRPENQLEAACVQNADRNSDRERLEVLIGAYGAI